MSAETVHRWGVVWGASALCWAAWLLVTAGRERRVRRRLDAALTQNSTCEEGSSGTPWIPFARRNMRARAGLRVPQGPGPVPDGVRRRNEVRNTVRRWLPVVGALCVGWVLIGGVGGLVAGVITGVGVKRWRAREECNRLTRDYDPAEVARRLPLAADLLAACITAGASPVSAARAVGEALGGPVGERLARGAAEVRLGGDPADAWRRLAALPGAGALARLLERAGDSGVPAAVPVGRLATQARAEWGRAATARARRAGVMVTAPVGLCFLPAFIAVGVLPVVIGLAGGLLEGGGG
ncbi:type II secretion system F family protein [Streptomyces sp. RY43-2]|uniref:Type II secretion system F family protein n=1 Tax=Streptomyces macrolidinus TaxID=2952607 RepID=A0ABT0ZDY6_9ACTN|nr:type II secretion system F family protein [Streptomyces macrolidinus]MCN9241773.1 type II secretion system F family protein [Streptomyces macrolidinus]